MKTTIRKIITLAIMICLIATSPVLKDSAFAVPENNGSIEINEQTFPNSVFRAYVSDNYDNNSDGSLSSEEIAAVTSIDVSGTYEEPGSITSLKGIEYFSALQSLSCGYNQLTSLDVSSNTALTFLYCNNNQLTSLNISSNTALTTLSCFSNQLTALDISQCPQLVALTTSAEPKIGYPSSYFSTADYSAYLAYDTCVALTPALSFGPGIAIDETNFPDPGFRQYVAGYDIDGNEQLSDVELAGVTFIAVNGTYEEPGSITSLEGIEYFSALQYLFCAYNQLTYLDVSNNTALQMLSCGNNQLTSLNVSNNTALTFLSCEYNQLTSLGVSSNTALTSLYCNNNQLTSLGVSSNTALTSLYCNNNQLTSLDVSSNSGLTYLLCQGNKLTALDVSQCPQLVELTETTTPSTDNYIRFYVEKETDYYCLSYDKGVALTPYWGYGPGIAIDEINFPDPAFRAYVYNNCDIDGNGQLSDVEINKVTEINVASYSQDEPGPITSLKGIEYFTGLKTLNCVNNRLTELDVSKNTLLETLDCGWSIADMFFGNQLTSLDLSNNPELTTLWCDNNQLTKLNISKNTKLTTLQCSRNKLAGLDVSNNTELFWLYCWGNQLTELDVNSNKKLAMFSCAQNQLTELDISQNSELLELYCNNNQLTELDVTDCSVLQKLSVSCNQLTELNICNCPQLQTLLCAGNNISELDVAACPNLQIFECGANPLGSLDLSNNTLIWHLACFENQLTSLDISNNTALQEMWCYGNQLESIDLTHCPQLSFLSCANNRLTKLNLSENPAMSKLFCFGNQITILDIIPCPNLVQLTADVVPVAEESHLNYTNDSCALYIDVGVRLITPLNPDFILPAALTEIADEAFTGGAFTCVKLPDNAVSIGYHAFADCPNLAYIYIPALTMQIDEEAFGTMQGLTILGKTGSTAETYAQNHNFNFIAVP